MNELAIIQAAQTAALLTVAGAVVYALGLLRKEFRQMREGLTHVRESFRRYEDLEQAIERIWKRIDEIEKAQGMRYDFEELSRFKRLMDAESARPAERPPEPPQPGAPESSS